MTRTNQEDQQRATAAGFSGPLVNNKKDEDDGYVEITLDIRDDSVAVHSVQEATTGQEDPELALLTKRTLHDINSKSSSSSSRFRTASSRVLTHVSQELKRLASKRSSTSSRRFHRTKSAAAQALKSLKFIAAKTGGASASAGWPAVENRFHQLTANSDGLLHSSLFGECIGIHPLAAVLGGPSTLVLTYSLSLSHHNHIFSSFFSFFYYY